MADGYELEVRLNEQAIRDLAKDDSMKEAMGILGAIAETEAKRLAPVDTGNLRRSITHEVDRDIEGWYTRYGTNLEYGLYQEIGTRFHPAQPYLRPALAAVRRFLRG